MIKYVFLIDKFFRECGQRAGNGFAKFKIFATDRLCVCVEGGGGGGGGGAEWREEGEVVPRSISSQFKVWDPLGPHYFKPPHAYV